MAMLLFCAVACAMPRPSAEPGLPNGQPCWHKLTPQHPVLNLSVVLTYIYVAGNSIKPRCQAQKQQGKPQAQCRAPCRVPCELRRARHNTAHMGRHNVRHIVRLSVRQSARQRTAKCKATESSPSVRQRIGQTLHESATVPGK